MTGPGTIGPGSIRRALLTVGACAVAAFGGAAQANASVIEASPELPLLGVPYTTGAGFCFAAADVCVSGGAFTLTSVLSNRIIGGNEVISTDATYSADLTKDDASKTPEGTVTLTGTIGQKVLGRIGLFEYPGSWPVQLLTMSLSGPLGGGTLSLALNSAMPSSGTTSVTPVISNDMQYFSISSSFDVNVDLKLTIPGKPTLTAARSATATATSMPEPATVALLGGALLILPAVRLRRR